MSLAGPLKALLLKVGLIILIIICLIGIIMFFLTLPGIVMEKLKGLAKAIGSAWADFWGTDQAKQFDNCRIYEVADYLDEMGYDLKGYGFVTKFLTTTDDATGDSDERSEIDGYDQGGAETEVTSENRKLTTDGVIRNTEDDSVVTAVSKFIETYMITDNYIYTIKNSNVTTPWWKALGVHIASLFTGSLKNKSGMLVFFHDGGDDGVGIRGGPYKPSELGYIKFDADSRKLLIKKGWTNDAMSYSLDGWTGRYGMPIDFLLSVHLATQMPDLAYDMATKYKTEVNILLHKSERRCIWII